MNTSTRNTPSKLFLASEISCCANSRNAQDDMGKDNKPIREYNSDIFMKLSTIFYIDSTSDVPSSYWSEAQDSFTQANIVLI